VRWNVEYDRDVIREDSRALCLGTFLQDQTTNLLHPQQGRRIQRKGRVQKALKKRKGKSARVERTPKQLPPWSKNDKRDLAVIMELGDTLSPKTGGIATKESDVNPCRLAPWGWAFFGWSTGKKNEASWGGC